jgi:hypothetical protein
MTILDDAGKPTVPKPYKGRINKDKLQDPAGIMHFLPRQLDLNRAGKYKIVIKATDNISGATTEQTMSLNVLPSAE